MNALKRMLVVLVVFLVLVVLISMFLPSTFHVERAVVIDADKEQVFKQVNDLRNWKNWSPWAEKDSTVYLIEENYSNPSSGVGATFTWDSENDELGEGEMKIIASEVNHKVDYEINLSMGQVLSAIVLDELENGVEVTWSMDVDFGFNPVAKYFGLFMDDAAGAEYEQGLKKLKKVAENMPKINTVTAEKKRVNKTWFLSIRDTIVPQEMNNAHGKMYAQISAYMQENEIEVGNAPIVIYHNWTDTLVDIEAGIPVLDSLELSGGIIKLNWIDSGNVVTAVHVGPYERLPETYYGINEYMRKNKVIVTGPPWEVYLTDPATEPNPEKWETAIYFPIK